MDIGELLSRNQLSHDRSIASIKADKAAERQLRSALIVDESTNLELERLLSSSQHKDVAKILERSLALAIEIGVFPLPERSELTPTDYLRCLLGMHGDTMFVWLVGRAISVEQHIKTVEMPNFKPKYKGEI